MWHYRNVVWLAGPLLLAGAIAVGAGPRNAGPKPPEGPRPLPPFLDAFRAPREPPLLSEAVTLPTALGLVGGHLVRQDVRERLPAVLFLPGEEGLTDWAKLSARELASVGYVVLAVDPGKGRAAWPAGEETLARLSAAVRWLRRRPDVLPERVGVVGCPGAGGRALALAAATPLQACVLCDGPVRTDPALLAGLRGTAVLGIFGGRDEAARAAARAFDRALAEARIPHHTLIYERDSVGFLGPPGRKAYDHEAADRAWFEIYEWLGKYVEDAAPPGAPAAAPAEAIASIADIMRAVNGATGVRGALVQSLEREPRTKLEWAGVRARAAVLAEAGLLLEARTPPRGSHGHWLGEARAYTAAARSIAAAADGHDYPAARRGLEVLGTRCAACHKQHR
jgi:dienelactone hydrolase